MDCLNSHFGLKTYIHILYLTSSMSFVPVVLVAGQHEVSITHESMFVSWV